MFFSIRTLALACLVGHSQVFQADAACGDQGEAEFNANGFAPYSTKISHRGL
jgi:hypothetical protein